MGDHFCSQENLMIKPEGHLDSPPPPTPLPGWLTQASWKAPVVLLIEELMCALTGSSFKPQYPIPPEGLCGQPVQLSTPGAAKHMPRGLVSGHPMGPVVLVP